MRTHVIGSFLFVALGIHGQVVLNRPIILTSTDSIARQVHGIAHPTSENNAVTLHTAQQGAATWGGATTTADTMLVTLDPPLTGYVDGLALSFQATSHSVNGLYLNVDGMGSSELVRSDGSSLQAGDVLSGQVLHVQYAGGRFHLIAGTARTCPTGFLRMNDQWCVQIDDNPPGTWAAAAEQCHSMGARLCTWDQYIYACQRGMPQLNALFDNWEWLDDTSDHTHTGDQAGRWSCNSQRSAGISNNDMGNSRCCYRLR